MTRLSLVLALLLGLTSCDCERGPTGAKAFVQNYLSTEGDRQPNPITLKRFQSSLNDLSFEELIELTDLIHSDFDRNFKQTESSRVLAREIWSRNPDLPGFHRVLAGYGEDDGFNKTLLKHIARTDPEGGWKMMRDFYLADYRAGNSGFTLGAALPFFTELQSHHPDLARGYFLPLAFEPKYESGSLKSDALSGIFAGMTKPEEAICFIEWVRHEQIDQRLVGMYSPYQIHPFLKINPRSNDMDLQRIEALGLTVLASLSSSEAENWIIQYQHNKTLPKEWARAYLFGIDRNKTPDLNSAFEFIARQTSPGDGALEGAFIDYFTRTKEEEKRLLKIQADASR